MPLQRGARAARLQHGIWMHQQAVPRRRDRHRHQPVRRAQYQPAQQHRPEVVAMAATAGHRLTGQREWIQRLARQRVRQQRIGRDQGGHARRGRTAHTRAQRDAFVDLHLEPERQIQRGMQRDQRRAGRVVLGHQRQVHRGAADRPDLHHARFNAPHRHGIANALDGVTKNVEPDPHVADRGRCERACFRHAALTHKRAPSPTATRSTSANTPAAVTSGPAPGPCTTSGLSQ
ncbi:hypothetical protein D3C71_1109100 [compost metagenome]